MDTASLQFIGFALLAALASNLNSSPRWRTNVLLLASFIFTALLLTKPYVIILMPLAGFLILGYAALILIQRGWHRASIVSILIVVACYLWLKKYTFLPQNTFLHFPYFTLGLSYIFFRVLHLLIEAGDQREEQSISLGSYLAYTLNFTTFVSGPIQRYDEFARDQFATHPLPLTAGDIGMQFERIIRGFFKVNVLAMLLHAVQQDALTQMSQPIGEGQKLYAAFRIAVVYPFFLYSNFSGYIDIVIAIARLMRLQLPENFDRPFSASSFLDFWNRWHITLSMWLKTYVYNPLLLTLMRQISAQSLQPLLGVFSFFVTFFLVGIWHGRTSEFVVFGILQGGGVSINKLWQLGLTRALSRKGYKHLSQYPVYVAFGRGLTFSWFAFTLFWFWADWAQIHAIFAAVSASAWAGIWVLIWLSATIVLAAWEWLRAALLSIATAEGPIFTSRYALVVYASLLGMIAIIVTVVLDQPAPDVIYKAF